jgi:pimeloyl-ACP methyl ester carboxylesterase
VAGGRPAGVVPAGLEEFYSQQLEWQPCEPFALSETVRAAYQSTRLSCANLIVPLDYAAPAGRTVSIGVLRSPASGGERIGSLVVNPGGPGASGMSAAAGLSSSPRTRSLRASFDFVGFDTRGTGGSRPLVQCWTDAEVDADRADTDTTRTPEGIAEIKQETADYVADCVARTGQSAGIDGTSFLLSLGTDTTVKDIDVLRAVLGDEKLTFLGYSYGTLLGRTYAVQFPKNVRALVLDGAVDPTADGDAQELGQARGFQAAFEAFARWCADQGSCPLGSDPARATAAYQQLTRPLREDPLPMADGRVLSYSDATTGTFYLLYFGEDGYEPLSTALSALAAGSGEQLMSAADGYLGRDEDGRYEGSTDVLTAVHCMDDPREDPNSTDITDEQAWVAAAPFMDDGDPVVPLPDACSLWPGQPTLKDAAPDPAALPPTVVVSTTGDPATPYEQGVALAKQMGATLVTVEGEQHTAFLQGIECLDGPVVRYLISLTPPVAGLRCS